MYPCRGLSHWHWRAGPRKLPANSCGYPTNVGGSRARKLPANVGGLLLGGNPKKELAATTTTSRNNAPALRDTRQEEGVKTSIGAAEFEPSMTFALETPPCQWFFHWSAGARSRNRTPVSSNRLRAHKTKHATKTRLLCIPLFPRSQS